MDYNDVSLPVEVRTKVKRERHFAGQCVVLPKSSSVGTFKMPVLTSGGKILSHSFCKDGG